MNNETENIIFKLMLMSSPDVLIPAMMQNLAHIYKYGDKEFAISKTVEYFNDMITKDAAIRVLTYENCPIFDVDDIRDDMLSYVFARTELTKRALAELES